MTKYVVTRKFTSKKSQKERSKRPSIQRLVTPLTLQHKRQRVAAVKSAQVAHKAEFAAYQQLLAQRTKEARDKRLSAKLSRRSSKKETPA